MGNEFNLTVNKRELSNKGGRKQLRKSGKIPGVFYSHDSKKSTLFYINIADLKDAQKSGSRVFNINVGNKKRTVLFKSVQYHPITDEVIHVDLYGIKMDQTVVVNILVKLLGTAKGVQEEGGILVQGLNELEVECLPMDIPESVEVDISHLALGESFRVEDLDEIEKITVKSSPDQILASVTQMMKEEEVVVVEEELEEIQKALIILASALDRQTNMLHPEKNPNSDLDDLVSKILDD